MKPRVRRAALLLGGVALLALLWGSHALRRPDPAAALRTQAFTAADGSRQTLAQWQGQALLVNFWAAWCAPCRAEMPLLERLFRAPGAPQVVGLAWDAPQNVAAFLAGTPVSYPVWTGGAEISALMRALGNTSGGLPFSVLLGADGRLLAAHAGLFDEAALVAWIDEHSEPNGGKMRGIMDNLQPSAANSRP